MNLKQWCLMAFGLWIISIPACTQFGGDKPAETRSAQQILIDASADTVDTLRKAPDSRSLNYLLEKAHGIMIFPEIVKAGFLVGGGAGKGVLLVRKADRSWSAPAFYSMGGGSIGLQIGVQRTAVVFLFMNPEVVETAIRSGFSIGADATVASGPGIVSAAVSTRNFPSDIYYFSSAEGFFAGVSLDGTLVSIDVGANSAYYGELADTRGILIEGTLDREGTEGIKKVLDQP